MKTNLLTLAGLLLLSAGYAADPKAVVRELVGPASASPTDKSTNGHLVVYSCWDSHSPVNYDYVARAPYDVRSPEGKLVRHVFNDAGGFDRYPVTLSLPAGEYEISSFVPGHGQITVPVELTPGRTTTLYFDGSGNRLKKQAPKEDLVLLPDGDVAGWRANPIAPAHHVVTHVKP